MSEQKRTVNCTNDVMRQCEYSVALTNYGYAASVCCDYIGKVGRMRGCDPRKCDKFKPKLRSVNCG